MSELLSTGQMIDRLKIGQFAECVDSKIADWIGMKIKAKEYSWNLISKNGEKEEFYLSKPMQECKWKIHPKYVSFSEAMQGIEEGKNAVCYFNDEVITIESYKNKVNAICHETYANSGGGSSILIAWIVAGKWVVGE